MVQGYLPTDDKRAGDGGWLLSDWEGEYLKPAIHAAQEILSLDPMPDPATLRQMWPMIEARAWARHRATRRRGTARAFSVTPAAPAVGTFFRFQGFDLRHARFDGTSQPTLRREVFIGVDAALLLPYDPVRDRVLLLEQVRIGPMVRSDPDPWMLEPVAGIVDARENPDAAALREAMEEAGIDIRTLVPAGEYYPSPGATTDYFYAYVGLCDLTEDAPYSGGLEAEAEDIRLHTMDFDAAMALADSGEISAGPLLHLLYWLARHRDRLRATG
jgi:nudix-type nucleoside diphosphatase (YffH/AdpP family)